MATTTESASPIKKLERHPPLSADQYSSIVQWCRDAINQNHDFLYDSKLFEPALQDACRRYNLPIASLQSFIRNTHVWHVKYTTRKVKSNLSQHVARYATESMWQIAKDNGYPPYLLARAMLELLIDTSGSSNSTTTIGRKGLTEAMRDPMRKLGSIEAIKEEYRASEQLEGPPLPLAASNDDEMISNTTADKQSSKKTTRLAREVMNVIALDPMYGPKHDEVRHNIGLEYEALLEHVLTTMDIPFETEDQLRERGTSRTPDVLLSTPIAIKVSPGRTASTSKDSGVDDDGNNEDDDWRVVCWIDSKALFGDAHTHKDSVLPQAESYIHRFGPGLLLYWFGHAPMLEDANGDLVICGWNLPETVLLPTGALATNPTY